MNYYNYQVEMENDYYVIDCYVVSEISGIISPNTDQPRLTLHYEIPTIGQAYAIKNVLCEMAYSSEAMRLLASLITLRMEEILENEEEYNG